MKKSRLNKDKARIEDWKTMEATVICKPTKKPVNYIDLCWKKELHMWRDIEKAMVKQLWKE